MIATRFLLISFLALLLTSCSQSASDTGLDAFGHLGETSGGSGDARYAVRAPFLQQGDRMTIALLAEYPGESLHPASLFIFKLAEKRTFRVDGGAGNGSEKTYWQQNFVAAGNKPFSVRYDISHNPIAQQLSLGEHDYSLDDGRVFLVDLSAQPVEVTQVKQDLTPLLPNERPDRDDLESVLDQLRGKHESVRAFLRVDAR